MAFLWGSLLLVIASAVGSQSAGIQLSLGSPGNFTEALAECGTSADHLHGQGVLAPSKLIAELLSNAALNTKVANPCRLRHQFVHIVIMLHARCCLGSNIPLWHIGHATRLL